MPLNNGDNKKGNDMATKKYNIKPMTTAQGFKVMDLFSTNETEAKLEMLKTSVYLDGEAMGDKILEIPFAETIKLIDEVLKVNGLADTGN